MATTRRTITPEHLAEQAQAGEAREQAHRGQRVVSAGSADVHGHGAGGPSPDATRSSAARRRARVRSGPSTSSDSKRGGPTRRPVTATRIGAWALPSFLPDRLGQRQRGGVQRCGGPVVGEGRVGVGGGGAGWQGPPRLRRPPCPTRRDRPSAPRGTGSRPWPAPRSSTATRSWTTGAMASKTDSSNAPVGHGHASPSSHGRHASMKAVVGMARMYSPFMWVSLTTSKKAGAWLTSSSRNHSPHLFDG